jgi:two-component system, OmpR family, response regulator PhoP
MEAHMGTRILTVEDDERIRTAVKMALEDEGWVVEEADTGEEALESFTNHPCDVVLIDIMLPGIDGFEVCRSIRRTSDVPVVMVTARDDTHDVVAGLEAGADDYLTKPFRMEELLARMNALLRRAAGFAHPVLTAGPLALDTRAKRATVDGAPVMLTAYEYRLLEYLMHRPGQAVSKTELTEHLYPDEADRDSNVIEVFVRRLRQKLDPQGTLQPIETQRGLGYALRLGLGLDEAEL